MMYTSDPALIVDTFPPVTTNSSASPYRTVRTVDASLYMNGDGDGRRDGDDDDSADA